MKGAIIVGVILLIAVVAGVLIYKNRYSLFQYLPNKSDIDYAMTDGLMKHKDSGEVFSGRLRTDIDSSSGNRVEIYSYKDGKLDGMNVAYMNGKIKELGNWKDGKQNGNFRLYTDEGVLVDNGYFKNGERDGVTEQFYPSGKLKIKLTYKNGLYDGTVYEYYEDGNVRLEIKYADGVKSGVAKEFYPNGKVRVELSYIDDVPNGDYIMYNDKGEVSVKGVFKDGQFTAEDDTEAGVEK